MVWSKVQEYLWITLGAVFNAVSMFAFVNPAHISAGGFSGLSSSLSYVLAPLFNLGYDTTVSVMFFALNVPLLICSLIFLRGDFTFKTIFATVVCTVVLALLAYLPEWHFSGNRLIAVIFGGILIGLAMYVASEYNGSNGGTEVIAKIVAKYHPEMDLSKIVMIANFVILLISCTIIIIVQGEDLTIVIYSFIYVLIGTNVMAMCKRGFNHPQKFMIVTTEYEQIASDITQQFKRGCTFLDVVNADPNSPPKKVVMVIVQYRLRRYLMRIVRQRDPHAFTFVKDVYDVFSRPTFNRSYKLK